MHPVTLRFSGNYLLYTSSPSQQTPLHVNKTGMMLNNPHTVRAAFDQLAQGKPQLPNLDIQIYGFRPVSLWQIGQGETQRHTFSPETDTMAYLVQTTQRHLPVAGTSSIYDRPFEAYFREKGLQFIKLGIRSDV